MITFLIAQVGVIAVTAPPVSAASGQGGAPMVLINPGGGVLANGSDGLKILINSNGVYTSAGIAGQDQFFFAGTYQYCCGAGAPMLNIGGMLFGQAGPASNSASWTSITVDQATGSTTTSLDSPMGTSIGSGTVTVHYTATSGGLSYAMDRAISYTYPNSYVSESYTFTIPNGNTSAVKFYLGGDTAPGSSDQGYGIMLTSPVRSVISLNTSSRIQFGMREVAGNKIFDGATSQSFYDPYGTVQSGGNIGYVVTAATHDAGLMVQWNLGSTPGTFTAALEEFVTYQEVGLSAQFRHTTFDYAVEEPFDFNLTNTLLTNSTGNGFTFTFPNGMAIGTGTQTNTCGGTLTATAATNLVTVSGVNVNATTNCLITIPVAVAAPGTYAVGPTSVSGIAGDIFNRVANSSVSAFSSVTSVPVWVDQALGAMTVGVYFNDGVVASGWPLPAFAITVGTLPGGLTLDTATGAVTGVPTTQGAYSFTVTASNSQGSITADFSGTVLGPPTPPVWTDQALSAMQAMVAYSDGVSASGSPLPTYSVSAGELPTGLTLDATTGAVAGTPTMRGAYDFTIQALNSQGSVSQQFTGTIPSVTSTAVSFSPEGPLYPNAFSVTATVTGVGTVNGGTVTFTRDGTGVGAVAVTNGTATLPGQSLPVGSYDYVATYGGATSFEPSSGSNSITVGKGIQTITFADPGNKLYSVGSFTVAPSSSSLLPVSVSSSTSSVCTVSGNTVALVTGGLCTLVVSQAGNGSWNAASSVSRSFEVLDAPQTITFDDPADRAWSDSTFDLAPTATSGLTVELASTTTDVCTVAGFTVTMMKAGTCSLTASQGGNANFVAATAVTSAISITTPIREGLGFVDLAPTRALDTRDSGSMPPAGSITELSLAGQFSVPADAVAVALNVTVDQPAEAGYVTVYPCGTAPPSASNVIYAAGETTSHAVTVYLGTGGKVCIFTMSSMHLVVDVDGAYNLSSRIGLVTGLVPTRLFDSRDSDTKVAAGTVHQVSVSGQGGVPANATAVVLNVTVDQPSTAGFLTVYPCGTVTPLASNLNFSANQTTSNSVVVAVGASGEVCVFAWADTHLVVDVTAAYSPTANSYLMPTDIIRLVDTRETGDAVTAGSVTEIVVARQGTLPANATAVVLNVTVDRPSSAGFLTVYPCGVETPVASTVNFSAGETTSNAVTVTVGVSGKVCVYSFASTQLIVDADASFTVT